MQITRIIKEIPSEVVNILTSLKKKLEKGLKFFEDTKAELKDIKKDLKNASSESEINALKKKLERQEKYLKRFEEK